MRGGGGCRGVGTIPIPDPVSNILIIPRPPGSEAVKALRGMPPTLKLYPRHDAPRMPEILDDKNAEAAKLCRSHALVPTREVSTICSNSGCMK